MIPIVEKRYRARWWSNRTPINAFDAANSLNEVAWRGHPAGTVRLQVNATRRGRSWEVTAVFTSRRYGWSVRALDGEHWERFEMFRRTKFAAIVPHSAKLREL